MKKKYVKPQILFEDMTLNTTIASCDFAYVTDCLSSPIIGEDGEKYIPVFYPKYDLTFVTSDGCDGGSGVCYHVSVESQDLLVSLS